MRAVMGAETIVLHLQDDDLRRHTILSGRRLPEDVGESFEVDAELRKRMKRFSSWKTGEEGVGPVRGHVVTFHKFFGVQAHIFVELRLDVGIRNVAVLVAEGRPVLLTPGSIRGLWAGVYSDIKEAWPEGLMVDIFYDKKMKKHLLVEENIGEISRIPRLGTSLRSELSASPAG